MAQLKVKQISDFVSSVNGIHDGTVGTAASTAIANVQSDVDVNAEAIALNTVKVGITTDQSSAIVANSAKVGITTDQADAIVANTAKVGITDAQSSAIVANTAKVGITDAQSSAIVANKDAIATEKGRIDALLLDSTTALDTFAEIVNFIGELDTADIVGLSAALSTAVSNDAVHTSGISANSEAIATLESTVGGLDFTVNLSKTADATTNTVVNSNGTDARLTGATEELAGLMTSADFRKLGEIEAGADVTDSVNVSAAGALMTGDITNLDEVKAFSSSDYDTAGSATSAEEAANDYTDDLINALGTAAYSATGDFDPAGSADAAETAANTYTDTEIAALDARIDGLEGASSDEVVATFVGTTRFSVAKAFDLNGHVAVFVNGLQVHELFGVGGEAEGWTSADGLAFTVQNLGYDLESDDHIIVSGTLA